MQVDGAMRVFGNSRHVHVLFGPDQIEIGWPEAERLHRAAKASPRVAVYPHKDATQWLRRLEGQRIHRASEIVAQAADVDGVGEVAGRAVVARREHALVLDDDGADVRGQLPDAA